MNEETGEKLRADLDHVIDEKKGIKGPHWDYTGPAKSNDKDLGLKLQWRLYPDGTNQLKEKSRRLLDKYTLKF